MAVPGACGECNPRIVAPAGASGSGAPAITARIGTTRPRPRLAPGLEKLPQSIPTTNHDLLFGTRPSLCHVEIGREFQFHRSASGGAAILFRLLARGRGLPEPSSLTASDRPVPYLPGASASRIAAPSSGLVTRIAKRFAAWASAVERLA